MHSFIPCLLLGLGVDDMFIIVQSLNLVQEKDKRKFSDPSCLELVYKPPILVEGTKAPLHDRIGRAMRHSGVGITITSLTDIAVFAIGGTTVSKMQRGMC